LTSNVQNVQFLHIHTNGDRDNELELIKEAKQQLNTDVMLKPVVATPASARVLAIGSSPDFICDHALVRDVENVDALKAALHWCITGEPDSRVTTMAKQISRIVGGEVKEIEDEVRT
jgi:hypothetical protein